jgi:adenine-specific DNA-methyltransferase
MDRATLHKIFEKAYNHQDWIEVLQSVFGARQLYAQPKPILLPNNERATEAFELGSFTTSDDRIIGLYRINVKSDVWLERNKVSLRELLRNVYKYDVDGAIVVFVQDEKWRLSFISEIKVLNDEGEIIKQATEPKRYTYLLGKDEKVRTPSDRLSKLTGKVISLQDMLNAFSVEALNEEFYKIVQSFFYELVGGKIGKGKKVTEYGKGILQLPHTDRSVRQEFAVRLIGRTVFCWFLKMKKSDDDIALLPETLLSSNAVKHYNNYYHSILERLFFQTLNTPMEERLSNLPEGTKTIPFLNGGLFEPNIEDYYKSDSQGNNQNNFGIGDDWFLRFFGELEKYNFTIDENSVTEIEVSVDPEMLGRIFENLLAEIDPDSGETARKATGSFYTPREIVDYMATESLVQYLHNQTGIVQEKVRPIFKMLETADPAFTDAEKNNILDALDQVKILDPACGSGAFPMGVLQKIVQALQKLDPEAEWWKKRQIDRIKNTTVKKLLKEKLSSSGVEYARKIGVIQNSLYGVDIQPVAAEISKLRCFLSLIVDENIDETKPNRGIEPLPNLEFKFVTADTLIKLPEEKQRSMFDNFEELQQLEDLRNEYIQSSGKAKARVKEQFLKVQQKIAKDQSSLFADINSKAYKLGHWNPFENDKSDWFDPKWMFGVEKFDVVIGNPPYVEFKNLNKETKAKLTEFKTTRGKYDLYIPFIEKPFDLIKENGTLCYICPTRFMHRDYGEEIRKFLIKNAQIIGIVDFGDSQIFKTATTYTGIFIFSKSELNDYEFPYNKTIQNTKGIIVSSEKLTSNPWYFENDETSKLFERMKVNTNTLEKVVDGIFQGVATGKDSVFLVKKEDIEKWKLEKDILQPFLKGKDIDKYEIKWSGTYCIYPYTIDGKVIPESIVKSKFPNTYKYLQENRDDLSGRDYFDKSSKLWFELWNQRNLERFQQPKIVTLDNASKNSFAFDNDNFIGTTTTYSIIVSNPNIELKFLLGVLNSKLLTYYHTKNTIPQSNGFYRYQATFIKNFPIVNAGDNEQKTISIFSNYILFLTTTKKEISNHVPNSHIAQLFEEVIDAMVMELYFKEDFENEGIEFIKYAERDFESIEEKDEQEQIEIIHNAYQKLREKDNEIRNNLKLMDIKLADIVMPIKAGK